MLDFIVMQMSKVNREKGYCKLNTSPREPVRVREFSAMRFLVIIISIVSNVKTLQLLNEAE